MNPTDKAENDLIGRAIELLNEEYGAHDDFNSAFNGDEPLKLGRLELDKSKVLFWLDRAGYYETKADWSNQTLQEQHQPCVDFLRENEHGSPIRELAEALKQKRIVPFVGAGLSQPMNMPLWGAALRRLHVRVCTPPDAEISQLIDQGRYLGAAQALADRSLVHTNNFIRSTYRVQQVTGPVLLLPDIAQGCIVTTNFDDAIEEVFRDKDITFDGYMHGTQQHNFFSRLVRGQRCLLKLHGDADDPQSYILTRNQYQEAYRTPFDFRLPLPKALRQIYISNSMLFLGCSLEQDWTMDLFRQVIDQHEYEIPNHFAILPKPADAAVAQAKAGALLELNIQPIWYPTDQHQFVEAMLGLALDIADGRVQFEI